jgi:hypothetical protein
LALAFTARRFNADWDTTTDAWEKDLLHGRSPIELTLMIAGSSTTQMHKSRLYASSLKLSLNLVIVHQMRLARHRERQDDSLTSSAYHNAVLAATRTLGHMEALDLSQITFAADTLLHFSLYAASFLWAVSFFHVAANVDVQRQQ